MSETTTMTRFFCCGPSCPGLPFRASDLAHPRSCLAQPATATDDTGRVYVVGDEPGVDVLPDGREVCVRTAWTVYALDDLEQCGHVVSDVDPFDFESGAPSSVSGDVWATWTDAGVRARFTDDEAAAVRLLVGLPEEEG